MGRAWVVHLGWDPCVWVWGGVGCGAAEIFLGHGGHVHTYIAQELLFLRDCVLPVHLQVLGCYSSDRPPQYSLHHAETMCTGSSVIYSTAGVAVSSIVAYDQYGRPYFQGYVRICEHNCSIRQEDRETGLQVAAYSTCTKQKQVVCKPGPRLLYRRRF